MHPTVRRTWAPRGQTPVLHQRGRSHQKVSGIAAISISPRRRRLGLHAHWHPNANIGAEEVIAFLSALLRHLRGHVILVWDRLNAHRAIAVREWRTIHPRLDVEWFPSYAPELNPVEYLWGYLKYHRMPNHGICELQSLHDTACTEFRRLSGRQSLLRSFIHAGKLPIQLN